MNEKPEVYGVNVDLQTRCAHYHQDIDVIAIKHYCCGKYYPCHLCHEETAGHPVVLCLLRGSQTPQYSAGSAPFN